jgi:hypothetical protein
LTALTPAPYQVQSVRALAPHTYLSQQITFQVVSEDLQSAPLQGLLLLDFQGFSAPIELLGQPIEIPPGHFDDPSAPPRKAINETFQFPADIQTGCHSVTLAVSHAFQAVLGTNKVTTKDDGDIATATWLYELSDPSDQNPGVGCGSLGTPMGDAGTDGSVR